MQRISMLFVVCVIGMCVAARSASAESVTFTTAFDFDSGPGVSNSVALNGATFTLFGGGGVNLSAPATEVAFGSLTFSGGATGSAMDTAAFDFTVSQSSPLPGGSGTSVGNEFIISVNRKGGLAEIIVSGGSVTIGNISYTLNDQSFVFAGSGSAAITGDISVTAAAPAPVAIPVPIAAWGGSALLGILGVGRLWTRRAVA